MSFICTYGQRYCEQLHNDVDTVAAKTMGHWPLMAQLFCTLCDIWLIHGNIVCKIRVHLIIEFIQRFNCLALALPHTHIYVYNKQLRWLHCSIVWFYCYCYDAIENFHVHNFIATILVSQHQHLVRKCVLIQYLSCSLQNGNCLYVGLWNSFMIKSEIITWPFNHLHHQNDRPDLETVTFITTS